MYQSLFNDVSMDNEFVDNSHTESQPSHHDTAMRSVGKVSVLTLKKPLLSKELHCWCKLSLLWSVVK